MADGKKSDLPVRTASAAAMLLVAGGALWLGGAFWTLFVVLVAAGVLWEWWGLICGFVPSVAGRIAWMLGGLVYVGQPVAGSSRKTSNINVASPT